MSEDKFSTIGSRFKEERLLWEARTNSSFSDAPCFSKAIIIAIESDRGGINKSQRLEMMILAEMDVLYILTGRRFGSGRGIPQSEQ
jgi:hypothetical protein